MKAERTQSPRLGRDRGLVTLQQCYRFAAIPAARLAETLWTAPLIGAGSLFGAQPNAHVEDGPNERVVHDFAPAPGFRFDVAMRRPEPLVFIVALTQPRRPAPYLDGELLWQMADDPAGALFAEHINTAQAQAAGARALAGAARSLRRWLFFRVGHPQVMRQLMDRMATLLDSDPSG